MKKLLIVSAHFPPLNTMASKRYGYMCKYMEKYGFEPYILTTRPRGGGYLNSKLDLEVPLSEERIIRIGDLGIDYPCLESEINEVLYQYSNDRVGSRIIEEQSLGWYYKVKNELDMEKLKDIDIVIGTFPAIGNIWVGRYVAEKLEKPFVVEIRDLISDYSESCNKNAFYQNIELQLEQKLVKDSAGIVAVTSGFREILRERYPNHKIITVYNGWEIQDKEDNHNKKNDYLYYAGSLYEHRVESIKIAIYGMGDIGKNLLADLRDSSVKVDYAIDKVVTNTEDIRVVSPEEKLEKVDAIVVTAIAYFDDINDNLSSKTDCPIISLEDIIYEMV